MNRQELGEVDVAVEGLSRSSVTDQAVANGRVLPADPDRSGRADRHLIGPQAAERVTQSQFLLFPRQPLSAEPLWRRWPQTHVI